MMTLIEEYNEFLRSINNISNVFIIRVKKELAYSVIFENELQIEDFLKIVNKELSKISEKEQNLIIPHLRDFKLRLLNI